MEYPIRKQFLVLIGLVLLFLFVQGLRHHNVLESVGLGAGLLAILDSAFGHPLSKSRGKEEGKSQTDREEARPRVKRSSPEVWSY